MKKRMIFLSILIGLQVISYTQTTTILRNLQPFTSVKAHNGILVELVPSDTFKTEIKYKNVEVKQIITKVENNNLVLKIDGNIMAREDVFIRVFFKELFRVEAFSNAEVNCDETLVQDYLTVQTKSNGKVYMDVDVSELKGKAVEGGIVYLHGRTGNIWFETSSKGSLDAFDLTAQHADLKSTLGGTIKLTVMETLKARATMNGAISYKGKPTIDVQKVSLGGQLNHLTE